MGFMNSSLGDKLTQVLPYIDPYQDSSPNILSIGAGTGILEKALANVIPGSTVFALDTSVPMIEKIREDVEESVDGNGGEVVPILADAESIPLADESVDVVILSSVVHEISSYKHNFQFGEEMKGFFKEAARVLKPGGRIIIRDFMQPPDPKEDILMEIGRKEAGDGMDPGDFIERFSQEFKGDDLSYIKDQIEELKRAGKWNSGAQIRIRSDHAFEAAAHFSWSKSFNEEVKEKYGYLPVSDYADFIHGVFQEAGAVAHTLAAKTYLQPGYAEHINGRLDLKDLDGNPRSLPNFTGVIVIEKR